MTTLINGMDRNLPGPAYVGAVIYAYHVNGPLGLVDTVDHPVRAATCGVIAAQLAGEGLADPVRVVQQRSGQELGDRCRDRQRQAARLPLAEDTTG
jgi:hypothetical protein